MPEIKYIFELTEEEVKILAYGGVPRELKEKLMEIAYYIDTKKKIETLRNKQSQSKKIKAENFVEKIRREYPKAYTKWTYLEDQDLKDQFLKGKSTKELSIQFQRQPGGIRARLMKLGLIEDNYNKKKG